MRNTLAEDTVTSELTVPYKSWLKWQNLPEAAAEDLLFIDSLTNYQRVWLTAFIALWDATREVSQ